ncbi:hypothetical protein GEV33_000225 [Tenebrio molitor]|uniref:Uncharacterized protein n=1 Tax=Tenebrio molitor TaxID=7067 RepID=A0A8J6HZP7_TENMO|nr:hypothetical protein GEV33_000225 [Tenebrio molitor]
MFLLSTAVKKSCVVLDFSPRTYLQDPQLGRSFRIQGVTGFFWLFVAPKKDLTPTDGSFKRKFGQPNLLGGPFVGPVQADPLSPPFFRLSFLRLYWSQQRPQQRQDRRAANPRRTPEDDAGGSD